MECLWCAEEKSAPLDHPALLGLIRSILFGVAHEEIPTDMGLRLGRPVCGMLEGFALMKFSWNPRQNMRW